MLSLIVMKIPTGNKAWIEDVVVDSKARGQGLGKALMNHALEEAKKLEVKSIDLTSRPTREAANLLYQSLGYQNGKLMFTGIRFPDSFTHSLHIQLLLP
jgi:ribosomal protein S18 acetylase RimI-like enzyme